MSEMEQRTKNHLLENRESGEFEIDLMELLFRLLEKWKWVVATAVVGALVMGFYSIMLATPVYQATSKIYVLNSSESAIDLSDLQIGTQLTSDYKEVFKTWEVHEMVMQNLNLKDNYSGMSARLGVSNPSNSRILYITIEHEDPHMAAAIANEYANVARRYISEIMKMDQPSLLSEALVPTSPISPKTTRNVVLGFVLGALLSCIAVIILFILDDKVKNADDVHKYIGVPVLAVIPSNNIGNSVNQKKSAAVRGSQNRRR